ncbi:PPE domain-containing protein [Mycobacterium sp. WMMD1722]|uniref:PPE domain-containing protein n=1 Tax=Mycobacterium sp. WMMD1722 TaxID=3404117 RepID=UPI003BF5FB0A
MSGQRVDPQTLRAQAESMTFPWVQLPAQAQRPDRLTATIAAVANVNANAEALGRYWSYAETENANIMGALRSAADAYQQVDEQYGVAIDNPDRAAAVDRITIADNSIPLPPVPESPAFEPVAAGSYSDVESTQQLFAEGDGGASLQVMAVNFGVLADHLDARSGAPDTTDWEGQAADAALQRHNTFNAWLEQLSQAYRNLALSAQKLRDAHLAAKAAHQSIYDQYMVKKQQLATAYRQRSANDPVIAQLQNDMHQLQQQSDDLRDGYAGQANISPAMPGAPDSAAPTGPATVGGGGGGGGGGPAKGMPAPGDVGSQGGAPAMSPASAGGQGGGSPAGGSAPGGGAPGGGSSGGGAPGGGLPGGLGGEPGGEPEPMPPLPDDPGLKPAGAGGGGPGGGAGGGAGAGGVPAGPLQPAVGAHSVAPAPASGTSGGGVAGAPAGAGAGGMGMGGMPMGGGHGGGRGGGGQDRKRTPGLSPDEDLYVEDRPYTEAIIGRQARRGPQEGKDPK